MKIVQIKHSYNEKFEFDIKNISLAENSIIGLVGENGAGKTTMMSILSGYLKANQIYEVELEKDDYKILFIPAEVKIYDFLTVREFLRMMRKYSSIDLSESEMIDLLELKGKEDCPIDELSQGMRKKLTLIPVFLKKYDLIILDEPFNSIDIKYIYKLKKVLREKKKESAILISSHILDTLADLCDEFIVLSHGKVAKKFKNNKSISDIEGEIFEGNN